MTEVFSLTALGASGALIEMSKSQQYTQEERMNSTGQLPDGNGQQAGTKRTEIKNRKVTQNKYI